MQDMIRITYEPNFIHLSQIFHVNISWQLKLKQIERNICVIWFWNQLWTDSIWTNQYFYTEKIIENFILFSILKMIKKNSAFFFESEINIESLFFYLFWTIG